MAKKPDKKLPVRRFMDRQQTGEVLGGLDPATVKRMEGEGPGKLKPVRFNNFNAKSGKVFYSVENVNAVADYAIRRRQA